MRHNTHLFHWQTERAHMDHQVGIQDNKTAALEEEYKLDPYQVGFDHVTPEPTEKEN